MSATTFLAETIWQQQEGTLMSIATILTVLLIVVILAGLSMEMKLGRANRIARASHDLLKALLEEQKKGNLMLQYLNDREYAKAKGKEENAEPRKQDGAGCPTPNAQSRMEEKKSEPDVYRI